MGCVWRSYPRFEFLEQIPFLKLDENSYDKVKLSLKNPDYKEISLNKFVYAYLYDLSTHGLKIDFDRYLLLHLLGYKTLVEPFVSARHHVDFDKLDDKLRATLLQDEMLKVAEGRFKAFFDEFKENLQGLTPKQRLEVVANLVRQMAILQGGRWDIVDKWVSVEKSLGLHALKSLAGSLYFWNYFMITITLREHYQTLLEKEEVLIQAGQGGYVKWDDWQLIKKWYDRAGSLTDVEYHLKNSQEALEKFIFELDWIPFIAGELGSEFLAYRIAQGVTSFLWNTAKVLSLLHPAGRLARGAFLLAKWFSQSIVAFATWLGLEWLLDGLIQKALRTPVEKLKNLFDLPNREFFGLTKEEFSYVVNYFAKKEALNLNITDPYASELFARLPPKAQALILSIVHRERIKSIAREAKKRIKREIAKIKPKEPRIPLPSGWNECFPPIQAPENEIKRDFNTIGELFDGFIRLSMIERTGDDEEPIRTVTSDYREHKEVRGNETVYLAEKTAHYVHDEYVYNSREQRLEQRGIPQARASVRSLLYLRSGDGFYEMEQRHTGEGFYVCKKAGGGSSIQYFYAHEFTEKTLRQFAFSTCTTLHTTYAESEFYQYQNECTRKRVQTQFTREFSIMVKRPIVHDYKYEDGQKFVLKLVHLLLNLNPSFIVRYDINLYRLYMRSEDTSYVDITGKKRKRIMASKLILLPDKPYTYVFTIKKGVFSERKTTSYEYVSRWEGQNFTHKLVTKELTQQTMFSYHYTLYASYTPAKDYIKAEYSISVYHLPLTTLESETTEVSEDGAYHREVKGDTDLEKRAQTKAYHKELLIPVFYRPLPVSEEFPNKFPNKKEEPYDPFSATIDLPDCVSLKELETDI